MHFDKFAKNDVLFIKGVHRSNVRVSKNRVNLNLSAGDWLNKLLDIHEEDTINQ